ncbi:hypothetical protein ACBR55_00035 [Salinicoccus roseus]|uniref:hypothetical protein n=1 Tax=Salinicoccus roseus TaxID=45670 RepID=UPI0035232A7F
MKNPGRIFLVTFFTALSILYLTGRYTTFEMHTPIFIILSIVLLLFLVSAMRDNHGRGTVEWAMLLLTVLMLMTALMA